MLKAAIVGATGIVGQQFLVALHHHPWFEVRQLAASERSAGKKYSQAIRDEKTGGLRWYCSEEPPSEAMDLNVVKTSELKLSECDIVFTAIEPEEAKILEPQLAQKVPVVSTASAFRYEEDTPILIPGVNSDHADLLDLQRSKRGWRGFITPIPNCTTTGLTITLKPIFDEFGVQSVLMTSMQAVSGAGRSPGVIALDIIDNVIPFIPNEEEKVQQETLKILGSFNGNSIKPADFGVSCTCTRVNVREGHTESVLVSTVKENSVEDVAKTMRGFDGGLREMGLPSAPKQMITVHDDPYRPQPRLDRDTENGMTTAVGRVRKDTVMKNGVKYLLVSHNTKMGAAAGAVLVAELLKKKDIL
ncbi:MAG: aspartate-semialdehyde dehydrogenase [Thaumarchaeota archaeon]|nr:aspartate-semialdehyde dehydrogenase [Nitrososphaerota archaeon]